MVVLIEAVLGPILIQALQRVLSKSQDTGPYAQTLEGLLDELTNDLRAEKEATKIMRAEYDKKIADLYLKYQASEQRQTGPFELKAKFATLPTPIILEATIKMVDA